MLRAGPFLFLALRASLIRPSLYFMTSLSLHQQQTPHSPLLSRMPMTNDDAILPADFSEWLDQRIDQMKVSGPADEHKRLGLMVDKALCHLFWERDLMPWEKKVVLHHLAHEDPHKALSFISSVTYSYGDVAALAPFREFFRAAHLIGNMRDHHFLHPDPSKNAFNIAHINPRKAYSQTPWTRAKVLAKSNFFQSITPITTDGPLVRISSTVITLFHLSVVAGLVGIAASFAPPLSFLSAWIPSMIGGSVGCLLPLGALNHVMKDDTNFTARAEALPFLFQATRDGIRKRLKNHLPKGRNFASLLSQEQLTYLELPASFQQQYTHSEFTEQVLWRTLSFSKLESTTDKLAGRLAHLESEYLLFSSRSGATVSTSDTTPYALGGSFISPSIPKTPDSSLASSPLNLPNNKNAKDLSALSGSHHDTLPDTFSVLLEQETPEAPRSKRHRL